MSGQKLRIKYHPAKKEIVFSRVFSSKEIPITAESGSVLLKYSNQKGTFVLQNFGNTFFEDILEACDGERSVQLEVITTKRDYEDFEQMLEHFNETSDIKITATLLAELPDMDATYEAVKKHGEDSIDILDKSRKDFYNIGSNNDKVKACISRFSKEIKNAVKRIEEKIAILDKDTVNVCFSGPYSSGKSCLINALIGQSILPVAINPETAAMFRICSPLPDEHIKVCFHIEDADDSFSEIIWDQDSEMFSFISGPSENITRKEIQNVINDCKGKPQFEQVCNILTVLNENNNIGRTIEVYYPIALDNQHIQFTIYDTPGTDSNVYEHTSILKDALAEQTHSILVFVTYPNGISGSGNRTLLSYLNDAEQNAEKSMIDLGRSLFVINYADSLDDEQDFEKLQTAKITNRDLGNTNDGNSFSIRLSDKKLYFTSAKYGYVAAAAKRSALTKKDQRLLNSGTSRDICEPELGHYYRFNHCAASEIATERSNKQNIEAFQRAVEAKDYPEQLWIASGLFALNNAIVEYGEKYAAAVKAHSIIDSVDKALGGLQRNAQSIEHQNTKDIQQVNREIEDIRTAISDSIATARRKRELVDGNQIPESDAQELGLDARSVEQQRNDTIKKIEKILLSAPQRILKTLNNSYNPNETTFTQAKESDIRRIIMEAASDYINHYEEKRKDLLEAMRDGFIKDIQKSIRRNGKLSQAAKDYLVTIETPEVEPFQDAEKYSELLHRHKFEKRFLWVNKTFMDRKNYLKDLKSQLRKDVGKRADDFKKNYCESLTAILHKVEDEFNMNMETYSDTLRAKLEDKEAMEKIREKILSAAESLQQCQDRLNEVIWDETHD